MKVYAGLDLHATNTYVAMIDGENKVLYKQRHRNDVPSILSALDPFKKEIQGVVVESTFNGYWLVDALMDHGYRVHLANVSAIKQYEGLKQIDDRRSSLWLANLLRLNILPTGYIYPKEERPTRDLLRKRLQLVRHRTSHVLSVKNILASNLGIRMKTDDIKKLRASEVSTLFADVEMRLAIMSSVGLIQHFQEEIDRIEKVMTKKFKVKDGCMVRKRPLTTTREKIKGQRARTVHSAHGLAPARKRSFLSGKEYFLDRCPLMGTNVAPSVTLGGEDYDLKASINRKISHECNKVGCIAWLGAHFCPFSFSPPRPFQGCS